MREYSSLSDNEKWEAVVSCDNSYDGLFFYGVKTTGIFCRPSCKAKTPGRENVVFFEGNKAAEDSGFRPCKKCCPDKAVFEPDMELVGKAKDIIALGYDNALILRETEKQLGVSTSHLARLFKKQLGITPSRYIIALRTAKAAELLRLTGASIVEVAYRTGFESISNFYKCFKEQTGYTPKEYRECGGK